MSITLKINCLRGQIAPLYCRYSGQTQAQEAYVELDENGIVTASYRGDIGGAITFDEYHGRTQTWSVSNRVRGDALVNLLESDDMRALFARVYDGHAITWDGNNRVGRLDDDAREASDEIESALTALSEDESATGAVWEVGLWLEYSSFDDLWPVGKTLAEAAEAIEESAEKESVELDGNINRYLLDRAERENERGKCYRPEVLTSLYEIGRCPWDENDEEWSPCA